MKRLQLFILTLGIACISLAVNGQGVPLGQWKDYLSYTQGVTVAQGNGKIFCVAGSGVFSYNTQDNSLERYNKVTGLSDVGPRVARFNTSANTLVIGYSDGNIDLIQGGRITNIPDLKNAPAQGSKTINNIYFIGNQAYISCGQGIILVDLVQDIIMYTYYIGPGGSALNVYGVSVCNDTLFAATGAGAYKIALSDPNFSNFNDWKLIKANPVPYPTPGRSVVFDCITTVGDSLFMAYSSSASTANSSTQIYGQDTLFTYSNGKWSYTHLTGGGAFTSGSQSVLALQTSVLKNANYLVLTVSYNVQVFNSLGVMASGIGNLGSNTIGPYSGPQDALIDGNGNRWIADGYYGLVKVDPNINVQSYDPPGPFSNAVASLNVAGDGTIWITPGGYTPGGSGPDYHNLPLSTFQDGTWSIIPPPTPSTNMNDVNCLAMDPTNPKHAFAGSFDNGIWEYNNTSVVNNYESPYIAPVGVAPNLWRVAGIAFDTLGNLWSTSCIAASNYLAVKKTDGTWVQFNFASFLNQGTQVLQLLVTRAGAKWMILPGNGILAFQDNGTFNQPSSSNTEIINSGTHHGALPSLNIYCMTEDLNGAVWVGTDQKVVVFYSPDNIYDGNGDWDASNVYVNQNGYTQYLMQNQTTNCIAVDGANRKWIGTQGGGAFLMSSDGTQQILNFTSTNSPLLSNNIQQIAINPKTGEVFFGTDQGIVSYRGTATEGNTQFTNVYAYPNPVPHGYDGPVAITGLVTNSDVKITTINGEIVYHTTALGGQAIWYGNNFDGKRVQTGVYLVFCASPDGTQTHIAKLLFIN